MGVTPTKKLSWSVPGGSKGRGTRTVTVNTVTGVWLVPVVLNMCADAEKKLMVLTAIASHTTVTKTKRVLLGEGDAAEKESTDLTVRIGNCVL